MDSKCQECSQEWQLGEDFLEWEACLWTLIWWHKWWTTLWYRKCYLIRNLCNRLYNRIQCCNKWCNKTLKCKLSSQTLNLWGAWWLLRIFKQQWTLWDLVGEQAIWVLWVANLALSRCQGHRELLLNLNQVELEPLVLLEQVQLGLNQLVLSELNQVPTQVLEQICKIHSWWILS